MNNLDSQYLDLLRDVLENGTLKDARNGNTLSVFGRTFRHDMQEGFPLLTTKKMAWKQIVTELLWFLRGDTNIRWLIEQGNKIWVGDAYKFYENNKPTNEEYPDTMDSFIERVMNDDAFSKEWGDLGPVYGAQWRKWGEGKKTIKTTTGPVIFDIPGIDQIQNIIDKLKSNPDDRRMLVSAWNVADLPKMKLPPCHYAFQVWTREIPHNERCEMFGKNDSEDRTGSYSKWLDENGYPKRYISLKWNQRSVDTFLGLPFDIGSYGLLLTMLADEVNMVPDELLADLGDTHIYEAHMDAVKEQLKNEPMKLPTVTVQDGIYCSSFSDVMLHDYISHPRIFAPLIN